MTCDVGCWLIVMSILNVIILRGSKYELGNYVMSYSVSGRTNGE
jgi:hypothetical protein